MARTTTPELRIKGVLWQPGYGGARDILTLTPFRSPIGQHVTLPNECVRHDQGIVPDFMRILALRTGIGTANFVDSPALVQVYGVGADRPAEDGPESIYLLGQLTGVEHPLHAGLIPLPFDSPYRSAQFTEIDYLSSCMKSYDDYSALQWIGRHVFGLEMRAEPIEADLRAAAASSTM